MLFVISWISFDHVISLKWTIHLTIPQCWVFIIFIWIIQDKNNKRKQISFNTSTLLQQAKRFGPNDDDNGYDDEDEDDEDDDYGDVEYDEDDLKNYVTSKSTSKVLDQNNNNITRKAVKNASKEFFKFISNQFRKSKLSSPALSSAQKSLLHQVHWQ